MEFEGVSTSFVVSGGGGAAITKLKKPERKPYSETEYAAHFFHRHWRQSTYGFSHLLITKDKPTLRHLDPRAKATPRPHPQPRGEGGPHRLRRDPVATRA